MPLRCRQLKHLIAYSPNRSLSIITISNDRMNTEKVNRVEVIDHTKSLEDGGGRAYVFWEKTAKVELQLQDDGRTLKIFISSVVNH